MFDESYIKTLRNIRNVLNACFEQAIFNKIIQSNPLIGVKLPRNETRGMRVLTTAETKKLLDVAYGCDHPFAYGVIITLYTGLRRGELLGLRWCDVNLEDTNPSISICHTLARQEKPNENDVDYTIVDWQPENKTAITLGKVKTQKSRRQIYLPRAAFECFLKLKDWNRQKEREAVTSWNSYNFVFPTLQGKVPQPEQFSEYFNMLVEKADIAHTNFHALRHTFATRGHEKGIEIVTLSEILGHAQPSTTLNMYTHSLDERKRRACEIFNTM